MIVAVKQSLHCIWTLSPFFPLYMKHSSRYGHGFSDSSSIFSSSFSLFTVLSSVSIFAVLALLLCSALECHLQKPVTAAAAQRSFFFFCLFFTCCSGVDL
ncbi:hypothetical protein AMECASPLE_005694 [Ameca splendens]|uniref:Uncharacterized protein n=1 Tax=Ameca splendens TaxID=208324 RepID=A0ABV1A5F5_9TELE